MRSEAHWTVAYIAVGLSAGLAAWSGVKASDPTSYVDQSIKGAIMFVIAVLGCHGWAWAARTWSDGHKVWATIAGIVLTVAMVVTLIGGAGSFYGAADEKQGAAARGTDAYNRADAEDKIKALTKHRTVGEIEPEIITAKADRRYRATQECHPDHITKSVNFCRDFRKLETEKAAAEEHERLDKLREPYLTVVGKGKPTAAGGWGALLAALFGMDVERGNALFSVLCTIALDMGAVVAVLTAELRSSQPAPPVKAPEPTTVIPEAEPVPAKLQPPRRPRLAAASNERSAGSIPEILAAVLEPAKGQRVEAMDELYPAYAARCAAEGKRAVTPEQFVEPAKRFCAAMRIKTRIEGDRIFLMDVRLAKHGKPQIA